MNIELIVYEKDIGQSKIALHGHASFEPKIGRHFNMTVLSENGIPKPIGYNFSTSVVRKIKGDMLITKKESYLFKTFPNVPINPKIETK